ncbi:hypothetical protein MTR_6g093140 [Medicago truncatula]|uniref:Uncharacterized protein n=1 Tax=Medicago truncatula TaxID=3880 RepID=A0A072UN56_MEDTR|nr:hypothetical protein MTR_6g093140 [Medicago truncatula]
MDICINPRIPQNPRITRETDIRTDMNRVRILYLSNGVDTDIILFASMDIHLHPYLRAWCPYPFFRLWWSKGEPII